MFIQVARNERVTTKARLFVHP